MATRCGVGLRTMRLGETSGKYVRLVSLFQIKIYLKSLVPSSVVLSCSCHPYYSQPTEFWTLSRYISNHVGGFYSLMTQ